MLYQDVRYALRVFAKAPGFVVMAVVVLGLGIGANTTLFSFINSYLLRPLPDVKDVDRVVELYSQRRDMWSSVSYADFADWRHQSRAFDALAAINFANPIVTGSADAERIRGVRVTDGFFTVFPVQPVLGRGFLASELTGAEPVMLISQGLWQRRFGGKPDVVGQTITMDGITYQIIGVLPRGFRFSWYESDFWMPLPADIAKTPRGRRMLDIMGRLKADVSLATAQTEMKTIGSRLASQFPETNADFSVAVVDLVTELGDGPRQSIQIMMGIVLFVLLIACANIANVQLARATGRAGEIAIRAALGASRSRIMRQVLTESVIISMLGGLLGLGLGYAGAKLLMATLPAEVRPLNEVVMDTRVLLFTVAVACLTGLISGLAPAFQVSAVNVNETLKEGGRSGTGAGSRGWLRSVLVVAEVSLAMILLLASGLLIRSFNGLQQVHPGFRVENLLTGHVWLPEAKYPKPEVRAAFFRDLVERLNAIPGAQVAAASNNIPMTGGGPSTSFLVDGRPAPPQGHPWTGRTRSITPLYFQALGTPVLKGRAFTDQDAAGALPVVIVNDLFARQFFPNDEPIGKRIKWSGDTTPWMTIVGVVGDVKAFGLGSKPVVEMFAPYRQQPRPDMFLLVRTQTSDPGSVAKAMRTVIRDVDRDQPLTNVRPMRSLVEETTVISKYMTLLTSIFAGIALFLAVLGIYGVISYSVVQRTHELGLRMALGAGAGTVIGLVLRQALWLIGIGIALGVPLAAAMTKLLQSYLYGVTARDPMTFIVIPVVLAAVALGASFAPARRATQVDPVIALRHE